MNNNGTNCEKNPIKCANIASSGVEQVDSTDSLSQSSATITDGTFLDKITSKVKGNFGNIEELYNVIRTANNVVSHDVVVEKLILDESWINAIDSALFSIENIIRAPKKSIQEEHRIVPVEKANKVGVQSIKHLASHSENIRSIIGLDINPTKVLTSTVDENLAIYENRFIITLINKLNGFIDERYKVMKKIVEVKTFESLGLESAFKIGRSKANIKLTLDIEDTPNLGANSKNITIFSKIDTIKRRLSNIKKSNFFIGLKSAKPIYPPIIKTNILTKNVDYNNAYKLWIFMGGYTEEGFSIEVEQKEMPCDDEYCDDLTAIAAILTATTAINHGIRREAFYNIDYRKIMERKYKVVSKVNYQPTFSAKSVSVGEEAVNQFYYDKMREQLSKAASLPHSSVLIKEKNISMPFGKFFRVVTKISNEMYREILFVPVKTSQKKKVTQFDKMSLEFVRQKEVVKRCRILSKLKADELERTLVNEAKEVIKLEKIKFELEYQGEKKLDKDINEQIRRVASRKVKKRDVKVATAAAQDIQGMMDAEKRRESNISKTRRIVVQERREQRERKLLEQLKKKYESNVSLNARVFSLDANAGSAGGAISVVAPVVSVSDVYVLDDYLKSEK